VIISVNIEGAESAVYEQLLITDLDVIFTAESFAVVDFDIFNFHGISKLA
jgi:hypothetical protein